MPERDRSRHEQQQPDHDDDPVQRSDVGEELLYSFHHWQLLWSAFRASARFRIGISVPRRHELQSVGEEAAYRATRQQASRHPAKNPLP